MPPKTFGLVEHRDDDAGPFPYSETFEATADDVWAAIDRLDCWEYSGIMVRPAHAEKPQLSILGCARLGYWVLWHGEAATTLQLTPNPDAEGSVDMATGNPVVDIPVRNLCDPAAMKEAVQAFLGDGVAARGLPWVEAR